MKIELPENIPSVLVANKSDLGRHDSLPSDAIFLSALTGEGLGDLEAKIETALLADVADETETVLTINARQNATLQRAEQSLDRAREALRVGVDDLRAGDAKSSVQALTYAAEGGEPLARWKLGSMYASGEVVPRDDVMAYKYFEQLVESYDEDALEPRDIGAISSAYVRVGVYSLTGIPNSEITPDPVRALEMFQFAAANFGDPEAEYRLARMYLDGSAIPRDAIQAARWLKLAAEKNHMEAQAVLGQLLFAGLDEVQRQRGCGLMWLAVASEAAGDAKKNAWIKDLYSTALTSASDLDRQAAGIFLENYLQKRACFR